MNRLALTLFLAAGLSCGPSSKTVVALHRTAVEAKLASIRAIGGLLPAELVPTGAAFTLNGPPPEFTPSPGKTNAVVMDVDHFAYPQPLLFKFRLSGDNPIADAVSLLGKGEFHGRSGDAEETAAYLQQFSGLRYLLVIRNMDVQEPKVLTGKLGSKTSFSAGSCSGDAILFDIEARKSVGGFRFSGASSGEVQAGVSNPQGYLSADLRINTESLISAEFQARYPGSRPPFRAR